MKNNLIILFLAFTALLACKKVRPTLGDPPSQTDAVFTAVPSATNANIIELTASNPNLVCRWDFGNGVKGEGVEVSATYPYAGTYTITLTVFNKGGSRSSTQQVVIAQTDLTLLDNPFYNKLTGGANGPGYKTWVIDSVLSGHLGVGPDPESPLGATPEWWAAAENEKPGCGLYNDKYLFHLNAFPGSFENLADFTAPYSNQMDKSWNLVEGAENTITISNGAFIGFYTGVNTYRILELTDSTMYLQYGHNLGGLNWYLKLKTE